MTNERDSWHGFIELLRDLSQSDPFDMHPFEARQPGIDTQLAVLVKSRPILVIFRGSNGIEDWSGSNYNCVSRSAPSYWGARFSVHEGACRSLKAVYHDMRALVRNLRHGRRVFLAGHSLGGALATLCAFRFEKIGGVSVQGVYSGVAPRVGNEASLEAFDGLVGDRSHRWVNNRDFATQLLSRGTWPDRSPYFYVSKFNHIYGNGRVRHGLADFQAKGSSLSDHEMGRYRLEMLKHLGKERRVNVNTPSWSLESERKAARVLDGQRNLYTLMNSGV